MSGGWLWIVAALVLGALEILLPGWILLGTAIAIGLMGIAILSGLWTAGLPLTLVAIAALSGLCWLALRRIFGSSRGDVRVWTRDINDHK